MLLTVSQLPTLVSITDGSNQYQSVNQVVGNATGGGQKQWDDKGDYSPLPTSGVSTHFVLLPHTCSHQSHLSIVLSQSNWICC